MARMMLGAIIEGIEESSSVVMVAAVYGMDVRKKKK